MPLSNSLQTPSHLLSPTTRYHSAPTFTVATIYSVSHGVPESKRAEEILPTPSQIDDAEAITQSRAPGSWWGPQIFLNTHAST